MTVAVIDDLFVRIRSTGFFLRFTLFTRILLAAGFIPTGIVKLLGQRFTTMPNTTPSGAFFEALYQTGLFWNFVGAVQVVAGVLLLTPRHAHLGALLFLPVMASITVINVALGFGLTTVITALMLLAALYLCCWDYDRFRSLFTSRPFEPRHRIPIEPRPRAWASGESGGSDRSGGGRVHAVAFHRVRPRHRQGHRHRRAARGRNGLVETDELRAVAAGARPGAQVERRVAGSADPPGRSLVNWMFCRPVSGSVVRAAACQPRSS